MIKTSPARHRLSAQDFHRLGEVGILASDARVELIEGEIIDMAPIGTRHAGTVEQLARVLHRAAGAYWVRTQQPIALGEHSEPVPDIALVVPDTDDYKTRHPQASDVLLIIEVAETSIRYDLDVKVALYAKHGIRELWVVDIARRELVLFRDEGGAGYATRATLLSDAIVAPVALPHAAVKLERILA
jgi:Uma2 family endonuclease